MFTHSADKARNGVSGNCNFSGGGQDGQPPAYIDRQTIIYKGYFVCLSTYVDKKDNSICPRIVRLWAKLPTRNRTIFGFSAVDPSTDRILYWTDRQLSPYRDSCLSCLSSPLTKYCLVGVCSSACPAKPNILLQ